MHLHRTPDLAALITHALALHQENGGHIHALEDSATVLATTLRNVNRKIDEQRGTRASDPEALRDAIASDLLCRGYAVQFAHHSGEHKIPGILVAVGAPAGQPNTILVMVGRPV